MIFSPVRVRGLQRNDARVVFQHIAIVKGAIPGSGGLRGAERAEARGPTNLHFSKSFFLTKNIFDY